MYCTRTENIKKWPVTIENIYAINNRWIIEQIVGGTCARQLVEGCDAKKNFQNYSKGDILHVFFFKISIHGKARFLIFGMESNCTAPLHSCVKTLNSPEIEKLQVQASVS